ncbi:MAG TPA: helix-turn-helix transcriptional regulator [Armatimonadota bacterium]|nr:helix-turn-helix transcriptional regulator [Armatimonadota bacterium]
MATTSTEIILAECPCTGKTLERLVRPAVLLMLAREPMHGFKIVRQLAAMPMFDGQQPNAAGVYRALKIMAEEGLVTPEWALSASGPAKRLYTLTARGEHCLASWLITLHDYRQSIDALLALGQDAVARWREGRATTTAARECPTRP